LNSSPLQLVFFGSGAFGVPTLAHLAKAHRVLAVVTQPDRPAGRGSTLTPTPIAQWCAEHAPAIPVLKPERASTAEVAERIRAFAADAWVVIAFGQKLSQALLTDRFAINLHASILPRWRGAAPIHAALLAGDAHIGNSIITLADRMDAGLVLAQSRHAVDAALTCGQWHDALAAEGPALVERVLRAHATGTLKPEAQDESRVTIAPKLSRADAWVCFEDSAEACRRRIHALTPWPGVTAILKQQELKLLRVEPVHIESAGADLRTLTPGALIDPLNGLVRCGKDTTLRLLEVQPAGRRAMDWAAFARGSRLAVGDLLSPKIAPPTPGDSA